MRSTMEGISTLSSFAQLTVVTFSLSRQSPLSSNSPYQKNYFKNKQEKFSTSVHAETINAEGYTTSLCSPRAQHATILVAELAL